jgi:hypothetical protein
MFVQYSATDMYGFDAMARRVAKHFSSSRQGVVMDSLTIGVAIIVALFIVVRLVLRHYFPPDT